VPPDHRIKLTFFGQLSQIAAEAVEGWSLRLALGTSATLLFGLLGFFAFHACS
jgi:hypothetical protein